MIFVTVGTQLPFDRLVGAVDAWAGRSGRTDVFAQIGPTELRPASLEWERQLEPPEFSTRIKNAELIIAHAGMGTIINALRAHKTLIVMPRRGDLGEHRNDHQVATVRELATRGLVHAAADESELVSMLDRYGSGESLPSLPPLSEFAEDRLINFIRGFVSGIG